MEQFRFKYAKDAVAMGQAFISESPGVRDQFSKIIGNISGAQSLGFQNQGNQWFTAYLQSESIDAQNANGLYGLIGTGVGVVGGVATGACWAAAEYFGWNTPDWFATRHWIFDVWEGRFANWFRKFYLKHGKKLAWVIRHCPPIKMALRPFFEHAAREGGKTW